MRVCVCVCMCMRVYLCTISISSGVVKHWLVRGSRRKHVGIWIAGRHEFFERGWRGPGRSGGFRPCRPYSIRIGWSKFRLLAGSNDLKCCRLPSKLNLGTRKMVVVAYLFSWVALSLGRMHCSMRHWAGEMDCSCRQFTKSWLIEVWK